MVSRPAPIGCGKVQQAASGLTARHDECPTAPHHPSGRRGAGRAGIHRRCRQPADHQGHPSKMTGTQPVAGQPPSEDGGQSDQRDAPRASAITANAVMGSTPGQRPMKPRRRQSGPGWHRGDEPQVRPTSWPSASSRIWVGMARMRLCSANARCSRRLTVTTRRWGEAGYPLSHG